MIIAVAVGCFCAGIVAGIGFLVWMAIGIADDGGMAC